MVVGFSRRDPEQDFATAYDAAEAKWARRVLRAEFAETQTDTKIANRLISAAGMYNAAERETYPHPDSIGWGFRRDALAKHGEDIGIFADIVADRYTHGGEAVHPSLKEIIGLVNADADKTPLAVARRLDSLWLIDEAADPPPAALKLRL